MNGAVIKYKCQKSLKNSPLLHHNLVLIPRRSQGGDVLWVAGLIPGLWPTRQPGLRTCLVIKPSQKELSPCINSCNATEQ